MPTALRKPVSRVTAGEYSGSGRGLRRIVISLCPGDLINLRFSGMKTSFDLPVGTLMTRAMAMSAGVDTKPKKRGL